WAGDPGDGRVDRGLVAEVGLDERRVRARRFLDVEDGHVARAQLGQELEQRGADAGGAAGDEGPLPGVVEVGHGRSFRDWLELGDGTAVDVEDGAGDERGVVGREERHRGGDVFRPTLALQQLDPSVVRPEQAVVTQQLGPTRSHDAAGAYRVDAHAVLAAASGQVHGEPLHAGLRRLVRRRR